MLRIPSLASSADDHNGSLKFGSYETSTPASLAALAAAICAVLQGSVIRLIEGVYPVQRAPALCGVWERVSVASLTLACAIRGDRDSNPRPSGHRR